MMNESFWISVRISKYDKNGLARDGKNDAGDPINYGRIGVRSLRTDIWMPCSIDA